MVRGSRLSPPHVPGAARQRHTHHVRRWTCRADGAVHERKPNIRCRQLLSLRKKTSSSASPHRRSHQSRQRDVGPQPRTRKKLRIDAWYATLRYPRTPMSSVTAPVGCGPTTAIATRSHDRRIPWPRKKLRRSPPRRAPRRAPRRPRSKSGQSAYLLPFIALAEEPQGSMLTMDGSSRFIHPMIADSESDLLPRASATESRPG